MLNMGSDLSYCEELVGIISKEKFDGECLALKNQALEQARCPHCRKKNARVTDDPNGGHPSWSDRILPCQYHSTKMQGRNMILSMIMRNSKS